MKFRRRTALLLSTFLVPSLCAGLALQETTARDISVGKRQLDAVKPAAVKEAILKAVDWATTTTSASSPKSTKSEVGTNDAPVDGLDGKPHQGPFVDPLPPKRAGSTQQPAAKNPKLEVEDGVMNDPNRTPPKEGTTGTEGGVSEKDRDRLAHEVKSGFKQTKVPDAPKEPPPVLTDERKGVAGDLKRQAATEKDAGTGDKGKTAATIAGLEKPADLPERPHDVPHPDPIDRTKDAALNKIGLESSTQKTTISTKEPSQEEGVHDLIPWDSFFGSFSSIAATEIGDKTFIVAALMAMRYPRLQVFTAAYSALFIMTILSGIAGHLVGAIISKRWSALLAALLFLIFGAKSIREGLAMSPDLGVSEEMQEVEAELEEKEVEMARTDRKHRSSISAYALESGRANGHGRRSRSRGGLAPRRDPSSSRSPSPSKPSLQSTAASIKNLFTLLLSPAWVETFSMTFVGELGDRSQIATVAMAAGQEYYWVMVGACLGHFICTAVAVIGGSVLAGRVSMRWVTLAGGATFVFFGLFTLYEAKQYFS